MSQYRVMLVDDEEDVMNVVRKKIKWNEIGLAEPVYASNGVEALELAEQVKPDIVLTDIKMPYMDGLELSKQLKQQYPNIRIIILSGFDEFEYAKEAVRLNAEEYLLKPIDSIHLKEVFVRIRDSLDKEISSRQNQQMLESYYRESLPVLRENFFTSLTQGKITTEEEIRSFMDNYQISLEGPYYAVAVFYTSTSHVPKDMNYMLLFMSVRKLIEEKINEKWTPYFFTYINHFCTIISLKNKKDLREFTDEMDRLCRLAKSVCRAEVTCGIGQVSSKLSDIPSAYNGARQAVSYRVLYGSGRAIQISEIAPQESEETSDIKETELREIFKCIKLNDPKRVEKAIDAYLKDNIPHTSLVSYNLFLMELVGQLGKFVKNNELEVHTIFGEHGLDYAELQTKDPSSLHMWMKEICAKIQNALQDNRTNSTKDFVQKAKEYVYEHYDNPELNLNLLCTELGVSASYFSSVFKKEMNQSFVNFLTEVRMNKAADLIVEQNEKSYIVATKVGYNDPNYFSFVFRRKFGVSPSKYKR